MNGPELVLTLAAVGGLAFGMYLLGYIMGASAVLSPKPASPPQTPTNDPVGE